MAAPQITPRDNSLQQPVSSRAFKRAGRTALGPYLIAAVVLLMFAGMSWAAPHPPKAAVVPAGSAIVRNPSDLPAPVGQRAPEVVRVPLAAQEVVAALDPAKHLYYRYWTFNGKVPGPMIRVRVGDTVELTLHNEAGNTMVHSIDVHAAFGPGGGAALMQAPPGQSKTFTFLATVPGLFVYHCGTPEIADHIANGMFGMILVEPPGGLPPVDHEYYVMQSEIYTAPVPPGRPAALDEAKLMAESPQYFVFNGAVGALTQQYPLKASVGQTVRIFFGNAGPNDTSSPHMVGEIFRRYFAFGSLSSPPLAGVQTATVPPGDAAIFEVKANMPGQFTLVDHAISRVQKGLAAVMNVTGADTAHLMYPGPDLTGATAALAVTPEDAAAAAAPANSAASRPPALAPLKGANAIAASAAGTKPIPAHQISLTEDREISSTLDALGNNWYGLYARQMYRLYKAKPMAVPRGWSELFHDFAPPAPAAGAASAQPVNLIGVRTDRVTMTGSGFVPAVIEITAGQTVTWQNTSGVIHTVVDDPDKALNQADVSMPDSARAFSSPFLLAAQSYSRVFSKPGIYRYVCTQHERDGMMGTVIVRPAGTAVASTTAP